MIFKWDARREAAGAKNSRPGTEGGGSGERTSDGLAISLHGMMARLLDGCQYTWFETKPDIVVMNDERTAPDTRHTIPFHLNTMGSKEMPDE
jgi:hypothetical protein